MRNIEATRSSSSSSLPTIPAEPGPAAIADVSLPPRGAVSEQRDQNGLPERTDLCLGYRFRGPSRHATSRGRELTKNFHKFNNTCRVEHVRHHL